MKIGYSELLECLDLGYGHNDSSSVALFDSIAELSKEARYRPSVDYTYDLIMLINNAGESSGAQVVRDKFFPEEPYDPSREV